MSTFGERLTAAIAERGPLCAGIDPHPGLLRSWGLGDDLAGLERFALGAAAALAPEVAAIKPQSAFFERFGSGGVAVLERVIALCREAGAQVVLDVKRGDIGTTARAYAEAYLDPRSSLAADAVTVSPYLGFGSVRPFLDLAAEHDAGVFVLALTSNPEGPEVQHARTAEGNTVAGRVLASLREANREAGAPRGAMGPYGAVVGATVAGTGEDFDIDGPLLVPGLGAQGGTAEDVRRLFGGVLGRVLPASSREILSAGPTPGALRDAARETAARMTEVVGR